MEQRDFRAVVGLHLMYFMLFFFNLVGMMNMSVENLGYFVWASVAVVNIILSAIIMVKTRRWGAMLSTAIGIMEVGFAGFIWILPYIFSVNI